MNYATGCAFNMNELFMNFPYQKLKLSCKDAKNINNDLHRDKLVKKVFRVFIKLLLEDIIANNVTFKLPVNVHDVEIHMKRIYDKDFVNARKNGKFKNVDFLNSYFSGYELELSILSKNGNKKTKHIYVDPKLKNKITLNTNKGVLYC